MQGKQVFETYESEVRSYCRTFPEIFTTAKGSVISGENGVDYLDFFCGAGAVNYGHNNDYIKARLVDYIQGDGIMHALDMMTKPKEDFLNFFENEILLPRGLNYKVMFPGPTGTNSVESALKLARKVTGRSQVWCFMGCFHGMTLGSLALTSDFGSRGGAGVDLGCVTHLPAPYMFEGLDNIAYIETLLTDDHSGVEKPAAIILETVQAEGGVWVFDADWLRDLRDLCDRHDILLIVDDIQVGCGRTGWFFSFQRAGIVPDVVCLSKSIGGYGLPFALTLFKPELDVWTPGEHNGTFRGNQLAMVAAKAGLEFMLDNHIEAEVQRKQKIVSDFMDEKVRPLVDDVRGIGLIWGIQMADGAAALAVSRACFDKGLIIERAGRDNNVVKLMPALTIPDEQLTRGLEIILESIQEVVRE